MWLIIRKTIAILVLRYHRCLVRYVEMFNEELFLQRAAQNINLGTKQTVAKTPSVHALQRSAMQESKVLVLFANRQYFF